MECLVDSLIPISQHGMFFLSENVHISVYVGMCVYIYRFMFIQVYIGTYIEM